MTNKPHTIGVNFEVHNQAQASALREAWTEILAGRRRARTDALDHGVDAVMERARIALQTIETAIRENPTSGQTGRLVRFLAGVYNGEDYPFDLTELRALDTELANACLDYLNYDRLAKQEVHHHLSGGDRALHSWMQYHGVERPLRFDNARKAALQQLAEQTGRHVDELLDEAVDLLADSRRRQPPKA